MQIRQRKKGRKEIYKGKKDRKKERKKEKNEG